MLTEFCINTDGLIKEQDFIIELSAHGKIFTAIIYILSISNRYGKPNYWS